MRRFAELAFGAVDLDWKEHIIQGKRFMRPAEANLLVGDPTRVRERLNW